MITIVLLVLQIIAIIIGVVAVMLGVFSLAIALFSMKTWWERITVIGSLIGWLIIGVWLARYIS